MALLDATCVVREHYPFQKRATIALLRDAPALCCSEQLWATWHACLEHAGLVRWATGSVALQAALTCELRLQAGDIPELVFALRAAHAEFSGKPRDWSEFAIVGGGNIDLHRVDAEDLLELARHFESSLPGDVYQEVLDVGRARDTAAEQSRRDALRQRWAEHDHVALPMSAADFDLITIAEHLAPSETYGAPSEAVEPLTEFEVFCDMLAEQWSDAMRDAGLWPWPYLDDEAEATQRLAFELRLTRAERAVLHELLLSAAERNLHDPDCYVPGRVFLHVRSADEFRALAAKVAPE